MKNHFYLFVAIISLIPYGLYGKPITFDQAISQAIILLQKQTTPTHSMYKPVFTAIRQELNNQARFDTQCDQLMVEQTVIESIVDTIIISHIKKTTQETAQKQPKKEAFKPITTKPTIAKQLSNNNTIKPQQKSWFTYIKQCSSLWWNQLRNLKNNSVEKPIYVHKHVPNNNSTKKPTYTHMSVPNQKGNTCGIHAACNALAIQNLVTRHEAITENGIAALNKQYLNNWNTLYQAMKKNNPHMSSDNIEIWDMLPITDELGLRNVYFVKHNHINQHTFTFEPIGVSTDVKTTIKDMFALFKKQNHQGIAHVICNTGGHWVEASIIKQAYKTPDIRYCNSTNTPLHYDLHAQRFVDYLRNNITG